MSFLSLTGITPNGLNALNILVDLGFTVSAGAHDDLLVKDTLDASVTPLSAEYLVDFLAIILLGEKPVPRKKLGLRKK